jgi:hypothetical protein
VNALTLSELRLRHAQLNERAERLRQQWRGTSSTSPRALALGKQVAALQGQVGDHPRCGGHVVSCPSGKIRYRDKTAALFALAMIRPRRERREKNEVKSYPCPQCHGWHLTSKRS